MPRSTLTITTVATVALVGGLLFWPISGRAPQQAATAPLPADLATASGLDLDAGPLLFEQNVGQAPDGAAFVARGGGLTLYAAPNRIAISAPVGERPQRAPERPGIDRPQLDPRQHALFSMEFLGARADAEASASIVRGTASYAMPADASGVVERQAPRYERVRFAETYPGIDLELYGVEHGMEYDFVVRPGADPSVIRLGFRNVDGVELNADGELSMQTPAGEIRQSAPVVYQQDGDRRSLVEARFEEAEPGVFLLALADYDRDRPLVIDPTIQFSGGFGGSGDDPFRDIDADPEGNLYVAGFTTQPNWLMAAASLSALLDEGPIPQQAGASYGFLLKLMSDGAGSYGIADVLMVGNTQYAQVSVSGDTVCVVGTAQLGAPPPDQQMGPGGQFDARLSCVRRDDFTTQAHLGVGGYSNDFGSAIDAWKDGRFLTAMDWSSVPTDVPPCDSADFNRDNYDGNGMPGFLNSYNWSLPTLDVLPDLENKRFETFDCTGHLLFGEGAVGGTSWVKSAPDFSSFLVGGATNAEFIGASNTTIGGGSAQGFFRPFNLRHSEGTVAGAFPGVDANVNVFTGSGEIIGDFLLQGWQFVAGETSSTARIHTSRWNTTQVSFDSLFFFPFGSPSGFNYPPRLKSIGFGLFFFGSSSNSITQFEPPVSNAPSSLSNQNMFYGLSEIDPDTGAIDNLWTYMAGNQTTTSDQVLLGLTCGLGFTPIGCGFTTGPGFPSAGGSSTYQGGAEDGLITQIYNPFLAPNALVMNGQFQNPGVQAPCGAYAAFANVMADASVVGTPVDGAFPTMLNGYQVQLLPEAGEPVPTELFGGFQSGQFNGMIPCDQPLGEARLQIVENADGDDPQTSNPVPLEIVAAAPQWATFADDSGQNVACLNASNSNLLVTQQNPARPGDVLQCFFFGGGQSTPACESIAPTDQLLILDADLQLTVGTDTQNPDAFIAPGFTCALDQMNFPVKMDLMVEELVPPGDNEAGLWLEVGKTAVFTKTLIEAQ